LHPEIFDSVVSISTPFLSAPALRDRTATGLTASDAGDDIDRQLAALRRPRKHYFSYCASRGANDDMWHAPQGVHDLLRELYYFKSADWSGNKPFPLTSWTASELAKMPTYYVMDLDKGMAQTLAEHQPSAAQIAACDWMSKADLQVYAAQFARTGFQGGLNYYRVDADDALAAELNVFAGRTIDVPACFIGGANEWAVYQSPGAFESMHAACTQLQGVHLVPHAGHSIVEERPEPINRLLLEFATRAPTISYPLREMSGFLEGRGHRAVV
jgi:pimeloyl-ACP methyl ester carboxylesterase